MESKGQAKKMDRNVFGSPRLNQTKPNLSLDNSGPVPPCEVPITARLCANHHTDNINDVSEVFKRRSGCKMAGCDDFCRAGEMMLRSCVCSLIVWHRAGSSQRPAGAQRPGGGRMEELRLGEASTVRPPPLLCRCELPARPYKAHGSPPFN